jgi:hypothetical protein
MHAYKFSLLFCLALNDQPCFGYIYNHRWSHLRFPCKCIQIPSRYGNGHEDLPVLAESPCDGTGLCGDGFTPVDPVDDPNYGVWNVDGHGHGEKKREIASFVNWYLMNKAGNLLCIYLMTAFFA